jgi:hypothetical protein
MIISNNRAYEQGYDDGYHRAPTPNPFPAVYEDHAEWEKGYTAGILRQLSDTKHDLKKLLDALKDPGLPTIKP